MVPIVPKRPSHRIVSYSNFYYIHNNRLITPDLISTLHCMMIFRGCMRSARRVSAVRPVSVDAAEVSKFARVGSDWWSPASSSGTGPLHGMNPARVAFIRDEVQRSRGARDLPPMRALSGLSVLDVGCGGGILAEALARLGAKVTAVDPSPENIATAQSHALTDERTRGIDYRTCTVEDVVLTGEKFDVVCSLEVLEHVPSPADFIRHCASCLRADEGSKGSLFLSTINRTAKSFAIAIVGAEYVTGIVPRGTHEWTKFITPDEMEGYLKECRLFLEERRGMVLDEAPPLLAGKLACGKALNWKLSETDLDVNYIVHARARMT